MFVRFTQKEAIMKKKKKIICIIVIIFTVYLMSDALGICLYGKKDGTCMADAAIVLGAATQNGQVSPVYRERLNHAVLLYRQNYVNKIIVTGGRAEGSEIADAQAAKKYVIGQGIPKEDVLTENKSAVTRENLLYSREIMESEGMVTALIVSDPLHMKRGMFLAEDLGIEAYSSPTATSRYQSLRTKIPFLLRELFFYEGYKILKMFSA